jgi:hypothetical protein
MRVTGKVGRRATHLPATGQQVPEHFAYADDFEIHDASKLATDETRIENEKTRKREEQIYRRRVRAAVDQMYQALARAMMFQPIRKKRASHSG